MLSVEESASLAQEAAMQADERASRAETRASSADESAARAEARALSAEETALELKLQLSDALKEAQAVSQRQAEAAARRSEEQARETSALADALQKKLDQAEKQHGAGACFPFFNPHPFSTFILVFFANKKKQFVVFTLFSNDMFIIYTHRHTPNSYKESEKLRLRTELCDAKAKDEAKRLEAAAHEAMREAEGALAEQKRQREQAMAQFR